MKCCWESLWSAEAHTQLKCQVWGTGALFLSPPFVRLPPPPQKKKSTCCMKLLTIVFLSWSFSTSVFAFIMRSWTCAEFSSTELPIHISHLSFILSPFCVLGLLRCCLNPLGDFRIVRVGKPCKGFLPTCALDQKCWLLACYWNVCSAMSKAWLRCQWKELCFHLNETGSWLCWQSPNLSPSSDVGLMLCGLQILW